MRRARAAAWGAAALLAFAWLLAPPARADAPPATPGPAERAGAAVDKTLGTVKDEVAAALMAARIRVSLLEHFGTDGTRIRIDAEGGQVTLSGRVEHRSTEKMAGEVASAVTGVREVRSRLEVAPSATPAGGATRVVREVEHGVADTLLEAKVKARLIEQLGKAGFAIDVRASDGVVSLSGRVPDGARHRIAEDTAAATAGVTRVIDLLKVGS
jgi:osmotically-inducible protein OsmY